MGIYAGVAPTTASSKPSRRQPASYKEARAMTNEPDLTRPMRLHLSRREFMKLTGLAGTGLVVAWAVGWAADLAAAQPSGQSWSGHTTPQDVDAWLSIGVDGVITL